MRFVCYNMKAVSQYIVATGQRTEYGGIAQLGERLNGIQEVSGSIPLISTKEASKSSDFEAFSFVFTIF